MPHLLDERLLAAFPFPEAGVVELSALAQRLQLPPRTLRTRLRALMRVGRVERLRPGLYRRVY